METKDRGVYLTLCAVIVIWGLNVVMIKYLAFFPPALIAAIRMSIAALTLLPIVLWKTGKVKITPKDWGYITAVGITSIALHQIFIAWGIQHTTAGTASLILGLNPLATALLAIPVLSEKLTKRKALGIILGFTGVLLVVATNSQGVSFNGWGDLLVFISMLLYVIGGLLIRKVTARGIPVLTVTAYSHLIASILLWATAATIYPIDVFLHIDTRPFTWLVIGTSAVLATGIGTLGWNYGIRQLGAGRTAIFLNGMPLTSLLFAALLLDEDLKIYHAVALLLIIMGVYLGSQKVAQISNKSDLSRANEKAWQSS